MQPPATRTNVPVPGIVRRVSAVPSNVAIGRVEMWRSCRVGLAPTGKRRLVTAHTLSGNEREWSDQYRALNHLGSPAPSVVVPAQLLVGLACRIARITLGLFLGRDRRLALYLFGGKESGRRFGF